MSMQIRIKSLWILFMMMLFITTSTYAMSKAKIQAKLNHVNGKAAECVMHKFYTNSGWIQIEGEVGRNGIDGLYYKRKHGRIQEVLVAESKWNTGRLGKSGKNKAIKQMSQTWVLRSLNRLVKYKPLPEYDTIKKFIEHNQYRARLFNLKPVGEDSIQIHLYKIKNKGQDSFEKIKERSLKVIKLAKLGNGFEEGVVDAYNDCRREALKSYFPTLRKKIIGKLLEDNYLKRKDLEKYLNR